MEEVEYRFSALASARKLIKRAAQGVIYGAISGALVGGIILATKQD